MLPAGCCGKKAQFRELFSLALEQHVASLSRRDRGATEEVIE